jgi:hypothetical protein
VGQNMRKAIGICLSSKYVHLCLVLLILYGISRVVTHTSHFEKILDSFANGCRCDYGARLCLLRENRLACEFYRDRYEERLASLTQGLFDYSDPKQAQAYWLSHGFLYDVWQERRGPSYLLAKVVDEGNYEAEGPREFSFRYYILGDKKISPFLECRDGEARRAFVSEGREAIYIHKDSLEPILQTYFDSLWERTSDDSFLDLEGLGQRTFYWDELSYHLFQDLGALCEMILAMRIYQSRQATREYFVSEAFKAYLPAMFAMGASLAGNRDSSSPEHIKYQRALLTGLAAEPNFVMIYLSRENPSLNVKEIGQEFYGRLPLGYEQQVTPSQISKTALKILETLEESSGPPKK